MGFLWISTKLSDLGMVNPVCMQRLGFSLAQSTHSVSNWFCPNWNAWLPGSRSHEHPLHQGQRSQTLNATRNQEEKIHVWYIRQWKWLRGAYPSANQAKQNIMILNWVQACKLAELDQRQWRQSGVDPSSTTNSENCAETFNLWLSVSTSVTLG